LEGSLAALQAQICQRHSASENFFFAKTINDFLEHQRSSQAIRIKDLIALEVEEEYLKRVYRLSEYQNKLQDLTEYYKYHNDIVRLFIFPESHILNKYYDRKRKIKYCEIAKLIELENRNNPHQPPKGIIGAEGDQSSDSSSGKLSETR